MVIKSHILNIKWLNNHFACPTLEKEETQRHCKEMKNASHHGMPLYDFLSLLLLRPSSAPLFFDWHRQVWNQFTEGKKHTHNLQCPLRSLKFNNIQGPRMSERSSQETYMSSFQYSTYLKHRFDPNHSSSAEMPTALLSTFVHIAWSKNGSQHSNGDPAGHLSMKRNVFVQTVSL